MAQWAKFKFFWDTMLGSTGSTLTATSTENSDDYDVDYLYNMFETNLWQAEATGLADPQYITYDAGAGNSKDADYLAILGHNLNTAGATVTLQYSQDPFGSDPATWTATAPKILGEYGYPTSPNGYRYECTVAGTTAATEPTWPTTRGNTVVDGTVTWTCWDDINNAFTGETPSADTVYLKEFISPGAKPYWRLRIAGHGSTAPYMAICIWGLTTELDYASASFDPYAQDIKANVGMSQGGYTTGIHTKYTERSFDLRIDDADDTLYQKVKTWFETHGLNNLFVAWDTTNNSGDVWLMRPTSKFNNRFNQTGVYRDIAISLTGRRE